MCKVHHEKQVTIKILNSIYLMLTKNDQESIMEVINELPDGLMDPMLRNFLSYEYIKPEVAVKLLLETFAIYKKYYGTVTDDVQFEAVMHEVDECIQKYEHSAEGYYARRILTTFLDEIDMEYQERRAKKAAS